MIWACHSSFPWPRTLKGLAPIPWQELLGNEAVLTAPPADLAEQQAQFRRKLKQVGIIQKCFQGPCQDKDAQEAVSTLGKKDRREARAAKKLEPKKRPGRPRKAKVPEVGADAENVEDSGPGKIVWRPPTLEGIEKMTVACGWQDLTEGSPSNGKPGRDDVSSKRPRSSEKPDDADALKKPRKQKESPAKKPSKEASGKTRKSEQALKSESAKPGKSRKSEAAPKGESAKRAKTRNSEDGPKSQSKKCQGDSQPCSEVQGVAVVQQGSDKAKDHSQVEKEKRRTRALQSHENLLAEKIPGLEVPKQLGGRISFTVTDPGEQGSSIGTVLYAESFYVAKAVDPSLWPDGISHLKAMKSFF